MKFYILQVSKKFEIEEEKNEDTSGEEQEEKDPPLLYSQFIVILRFESMLEYR